MAIIVKPIKWLLAALVIALVVWAYFDFSRRYVQHRQALKERPIELTVMHWGEPAEDKIVADLTARFVAENPDVRIVRINPGALTYNNKLKTMMAANIAPDVFYLPPALLPELADNKLIEPLDDFFAKEPEALKKDYFPILLEAFHYESATGLLGRGKLYGLPKDFTTACFYVNIDLCEKAGVDWREIQKNGWDWPRFEAEMKKIRALDGTPEFAGRTVYGTILQLWPDSLRNMLWTYDGDFFKKKPDGTIDFTTLALDEPGSQQAMELIRRLRLVDKTAYNSTGIAKDGGQEFKNGNIGCIGPVGQWYVLQYQPITSFKWDMVPVPSGSVKASQTFYNGWTMSTKTPNKARAYELIRFLTGREGQVQQARSGLSIPALQSVARSDDFLRPPGVPVKNEQVFLDAIEYAKLPQLPKQSEFPTLIQTNTDLALAAGRLSTADAAALTQREWHRELTSPLRATDWPTMPWRPILLAAAAALAAILTFLFIRVRREKLGPIDRATERSGFTFIAPWVIGFAVFTLGPMVVSLLLAFSQWSGIVPLAEAQSVGLANFRQLFTYDPLFLQSLKVTAYFVILGVPVAQIAALLIALLMNQKVRGITVFRTIYFVPSVVSGAALAILWLQLFNNDYGLINQMLRPILRPVGRSLTLLSVLLLAAGAIAWIVVLRRQRRREDVGPGDGLLSGTVLGAGTMLLIVGLVMLVKGVVGPNAPNWFGYDVSTGDSVNDAARWAVPGFVLMGLWGVGGGMIIYLAGLKGINPSLYEAARIDGAGRMRQLWNVTLPMLSPLIFYNLVMGIIGSFQVFTQAYIMTGDTAEHATLFYVLSLYMQAFEYHKMGYASAMAWVLFVIVLVLTLVVFKGSKKLVYYEGLK